MINQNKKFFYEEAFSRNSGFLNKEQQDKIKNATIAIAGLGGSGGTYAYTLARTGFTKFHIADFDTFSLVNFNRQAGATVDTLDMKKTEVVKNLILSINPLAEVTTFEDGVNEENIDIFLKNVDVVLDGIDFFAIKARRLLFKKSQEKKLYVVSSGPIGFGAAMLVFSPRSPSFDAYMNINDTMSDQRKLLQFGLGLTPSLMQIKYFKPNKVSWKDGEHKAPSLGVGIQLVSNLAVVETIKIVTGQISKVFCVPSTVHFDSYLGKYKKTYMPFGNKNPLQRIKIFIAMTILKRRGDL